MATRVLMLAREPQASGGVRVLESVQNCGRGLSNVSVSSALWLVGHVYGGSRICPAHFLDTHQPVFQALYLTRRGRWSFISAALSYQRGLWLWLCCTDCRRSSHALCTGWVWWWSAGCGLFWAGLAREGDTMRENRGGKRCRAWSFYHINRE